MTRVVLDLLHAIGQRVMRVHHEGALWGGGAVLVHQFPFDATQNYTEPGDSISICVATNQSTGQSFDFVALFAILKELENDDLMPAENLFNALP